VELLDLKHLEAAIGRQPSPNRSGRNPLAAEITSLKRQMTKLFPDSVCLRETTAAAA